MTLWPLVMKVSSVLSSLLIYVTPRRTHSALICVTARKAGSLLNMSGERIGGKIPAILKFCWIRGLSHPARLTWKPLRGLHLNGAFGNTEYGAALEPLKLISLCRV